MVNVSQKQEIAPTCVNLLPWQALTSSALASFMGRDGWALGEKGWGPKAKEKGWTPMLSG
jgi:hypothetical protein